MSPAVADLSGWMVAFSARGLGPIIMGTFPTRLRGTCCLHQDTADYSSTQSEKNEKPGDSTTKSTWVVSGLGMTLGRVWPLVRPVGVRALPVCVLRRTSGGGIGVGPGVGRRVFSGIPEGPGAIPPTPTATNTKN